MGGFAQLVPLIAKFVGVGGPLGLIIGGVVVGLGAMAAASKPVRQAFEKIWDALEKVWEALEPV